MKRIGMILLACLLLALPTVAQAQEKPAPNDLVVTAEIVGYSHKPAGSAVNKPQLILYVRLSVRNQTNSPREITFYSCSWYASWIQKGTVAGFDVMGCDKNYPRTLPIPANQSIVFYGPVRVRENSDEPTTFALGFVDFTAAEFSSKAFRKDTWRDKLLESKAVYWSNELNSNIDPATTPEIRGSDQYPTYRLTWEDR
ncbi:hypothetical protein [Hymenobacter sp. UYCo722]|uniref:hypothetical protein n=1 Tax=Hymenobacter sp. UYCo722 TaxID=3156335 RepID=UPI0033940912